MKQALKWAGRGLLGVLALVLLLNGVGLAVWVLANRDRLAEERRRELQPADPGDITSLVPAASDVPPPPPPVVPDLIPPAD